MRVTNKRLNFELDRNDKAVIYIKSESGDDISCMIDTGANVPIWFMGEKYIKLRYPSAYQTEKKTIIHGLGKNPIIDVPVWIIPSFEVMDDESNSITFHDLLVPVINAQRYSFNMILPLTILNRMKFTFDYEQSATSAFFSIETSKDDYYVRPIYSSEDNNYINKIQAFFQNEITEA
ncbi:hypothetical protein [Butyrivibrio sp. FC2001]|uniref:hypothetical protein n=1 Tax=Butyrivibrio sp. FC2001 TaxID=1280671 RepID=UPI00047AE25C|nr:hypothetical protein [Butyrivibrio sp. FC2001]